MAYPPPNPGYPGYPSAPGGPAPYPPQQGGAWVPGQSSAPYPPPPDMSGGGGPSIGFGAVSPQPSSTYPPYPPSQPSSTFPPSYPPSHPPSSYPPTQPPSSYPPTQPPSSYPPPPSTNYPSPPTGSYPPSQPPSHSTYPPPPSTSTYPPPPSHSTYPPPPSTSTYPPPPSTSYPPPPPTSTYPPPPSTSYPPPPTHGHDVDYQQSTGGYPTAPPPVPSPHSHPPPSQQMAHMSISSGASKQKSPATSAVPKAPSTHGTVKPHSPFDAEEDARTLRTAMKGFGTDEKAIISVLAYRSNEQRQKIKLKFKTMYGKDLIKELKGELSGNFEDVVLALMMTPTEYDASEVYNAIKGIGTDESTLIEILCTRTNEEIEALKRQYKSDHGQSVEKDVASDTSGHFKRLLVSLLTGGRDSDTAVDTQRARADAQALYQAGEARWGTDESKFNQILVSRSFAHLRVVFQEYSKICKYDIEQSVSREMSGDLKTGMLTVVKCVKDKSAYFAERLYRSMKGLGTDDHTLVRVMVTRCEVDMEQIKDKFYRNYHKTLGSFIKGDTSGDYRRILMALARADD